MSEHSENIEASSLIDLLEKLMGETKDSRKPWRVFLDNNVTVDVQESGYFPMGGQRDGHYVDHRLSYSIYDPDSHNYLGDVGVDHPTLHSYLLPVDMMYRTHDSYEPIGVTKSITVAIERLLAYNKEKLIVGLSQEEVKAFNATTLTLAENSSLADRRADFTQAPPAEQPEPPRDPEAFVATVDENIDAARVDTYDEGDVPF